MKRYIGIFAHPDDEAFGPGGSFIQWSAQPGATTHVLTATKGELGGESGVDKIRTAEMEQSGKHLGLSSHHFLGFKDGELRNSIYSDIADKIIETLNQIIEPQDDVTIISFERNGITGHLDHIAMSLITTHVCAKWSEVLPKVSSLELLYFCLSASRKPVPDAGYFVFSPAGIPNDEIDLVNDVSDVLDQKKTAISSHSSQGAENFLEQVGDEELSYESFVRCKDI